MGAGSATTGSSGGGGGGGGGGGNPLREVLFLIQNTSLSVKVLSLVLLLLYSLSAVIGSSAANSLLLGVSVTPGYFWPPHFWIWTAFTHCFLEVHLWEVILDLVILALVGKLLEPLWGALEMVLFFVVVNVGVAIVSAFFYYLLYMLTFNTELLFEVHIHGETRRTSFHSDPYTAVTYLKLHAYSR